VVWEGGERKLTPYPIWRPQGKAVGLRAYPDIAVTSAIADVISPLCTS
jgi:hypothetical protein